MSWCSNVIQMRFNRSQHRLLTLEVFFKNIQETIKRTMITFFASRIIKSRKKNIHVNYSTIKVHFWHCIKIPAYVTREQPSKNKIQKSYSTLFSSFHCAYICNLMSESTLGLVLYYAMSIQESMMIVLCCTKTFGRWVCLTLRHSWRVQDFNVKCFLEM